jgi:hypothetical protein
MLWGVRRGAGCSRAVVVTGAVVDTARRPRRRLRPAPPFSGLTAVIGRASGCPRGAVQAGADNSPRTFRQRLGYYVWTFSQSERRNPWPWP